MGIAKNINKIKMPSYINENFAKILGYYLGDGNYEKNRLTFSEQRKEIAEHYQRLIKEVFDVDSDLRFREDKNYFRFGGISGDCGDILRFVVLARPNCADDYSASCGCGWEFISKEKSIIIV